MIQLSLFLMGNISITFLYNLQYIAADISFVDYSGQVLTTHDDIDFSYPQKTMEQKQKTAKLFKLQIKKKHLFCVKDVSS